MTMPALSASLSRAIEQLSAAASALSPVTPAAQVWISAAGDVVALEAMPGATVVLARRGGTLAFVRGFSVDHSAESDDAAEAFLAGIALAGQLSGVALVAGSIDPGFAQNHVDSAVLAELGLGGVQLDLVLQAAATLARQATPADAVPAEVNDLLARVAAGLIEGERRCMV